jgi:DNA-binding MarR family transcriptional regulator
MQPPPDSTPLGLLVASVRRHIKQAVVSRLRPRRLGYQQFWLLVAIHERSGLSLRELAERQHMDSPTASRIAAALARRRLATVDGDPGDRRIRRFRLTRRGEALAREVYPLAAQAREAAEDGFSEAEGRDLRRMLAQMIANMERFERRAG